MTCAEQVDLEAGSPYPLCDSRTKFTPIKIEPISGFAPWV